jgi:hypothetical protein
VWLSADVVAAHTGRYLVSPAWRGPTPGRRSVGWLLLEIPATIFFVGMIQLLMWGLLTDSSQMTLTRIIAVGELVFSAAWTLYIVGTVARVRRAS